MLVLSRNLNERIVIGETIVIQVLELGGGRVRIGVEAPSDVPIWREEVTLAREFHDSSYHPIRKTRESAISLAAR